PVESFCLFFAPGAVESVRRSLAAPLDRLLDDPLPAGLPERPFVERTYPHDDLLSPALFGLRAELAAGPREPGWLSERFHAVLERMLVAHQRVGAEIALLPAARRATREELYRRVHLARDYARALFDAPLSLDELAGVAGLSPNHLLRAFRQAFGQTPHQYLTGLRLDRARQLLRETDDPVTEICLAVGFSSLGSFSWLFRRAAGEPPLRYRRRFR
ncbi:MAG TPA: AraC family transcriptional regulator, partial [Herpetosiphonaceae bacterium]